MKIYTKTGDNGETSLLSGSRVTKDCITLRVVGELDELNSILGIVNALLQKRGIPPQGRDDSVVVQRNNFELLNTLNNIQKDIFKISAELASLQNNKQTVIARKDDGAISIKDIENLEKQIDLMEKELPELKNFILPSGSVVGSNFHLARAVCRRVERELVSFSKEKEIRPEVFAYLNRLSDLLFVSARFVNLKLGKEELIIK